MATGLFTHPEFLKHEMGHHHPECPDRLRAIEDQLIASRIGLPKFFVWLLFNPNYVRGGFNYLIVNQHLLRPRSRKQKEPC